MPLLISLSGRFTHAKQGPSSDPGPRLY